MRTFLPKTDRGREQGFTLMEMMVVLAIMGLLAAVAVGRLSSGGDHAGRLRIIARLRMDLASAREQALVTGNAVPLAIAASTRREVRVQTGNGSPLTFYGDGSSSGAVIDVGGVPALTIDWLTGAVSDAG